jgi:hypothetical protein
MFEKFLMSLQKVEKARTDLEKEGIYRLRYRVYIEELDKGFLPNVDHDNKLIKDPEDDNPDMGLFYTGDPGNPTGTIRVDTYRPGGVPEDVAKRFSLHLFPWLADQTIAEAGRLIISPDHRGVFILPSLARKLYEWCVVEKGIDHAFLYCAPGLAKAYERIGFRAYAGDLVFNSDGVRVPMISIGSDLAFYKKVKSPLAPLVKQHYGHGKRAPVDLEPYQSLLGDDNAPYQLDPGEICHQMEEAFFSIQEQRPRLIRNLPPDIIKELGSRGFVIEVPERKNLVRKGLNEKEMFLIIDGIFEVFDKEKTIAILNPGDIFGELAFFLDSGKRTASIRSLSPGRILVLRRRFLDELMIKKPAVAAKLLLNINTILAQRLAHLLES